MQTRTTITEQCGAQWVAAATGAQGARAYWVLLLHGRSAARPGVVGFYAASVNAACDALKN
jgi:hypothetical protein